MTLGIIYTPVRVELVGKVQFFFSHYHCGRTGVRQRNHFLYEFFFCEFLQREGKRGFACLSKCLSFNLIEQRLERSETSRPVSTQYVRLSRVHDWPLKQFFKSVSIFFFFLFVQNSVKNAFSLHTIIRKRGPLKRWHLRRRRPERVVRGGASRLETSPAAGKTGAGF